MTDNESSSDGSAEEIQMSERAAQIASIGRDFSNYTYDANFAVYFKLIHNSKEIDEDIRVDTFFPDFVHQFFVDSERIFGYKKPLIRLYYSASRLKRYVRFDYEDQLTKDKDGIEPDSVMECLEPILDGLEYTQDLKQFAQEVESKDELEFKPPGNLLQEFEIDYRKKKILSRAEKEQIEIGGQRLTSNGTCNGHSTNGDSKSHNGQSQPPTMLPGPSSSEDTEPTCKKRFQIYHASADTSNFARFQARMQTLIMWFIESANMIDFQDTKWDFFLIFEKYNPSTSVDPNATSISTEDRFFFAGYATVYRYYAYPDRTRPRVSQMLLLPPYRRNHLGTALLQSIYDYFAKQPATLDITAEDPDEEFIAMRDLLDCKNCLRLAKFQPDQLKLGWSDDKAKEAQEKLKLCQRQSRKVYEILKLKYIDRSDEDEYRKYRLEIKNRLNIPYQRLKLDCDKIEKRGYDLPEKMKVRKDNPKLVAATLDENYHELVKQYQHTIDKLNATTQPQVPS